MNLSSMKHREERHWTVQPVTLRHNEWALQQTGDVIAVAFFPEVQEAKYVAKRLNAGKLCFDALRALVSIEHHVQEGATQTLMDDAYVAIAEYSKNDF